MEPLITIETVPIKIEFVEKESYDVSSVHNSEFETSQNNEQNQIQSKAIRIEVQDSFVPSQVYQWDNATYTATSQYDQDGNLQLNINMEDGAAQSIRFKQANRSIESMTSQVNGIETGSMLINIPMNQISISSVGSGNSNTEYLPPDLELVVTQRPDVIIKYVGGPIYVPPSADPNYVPPIGFEQNQPNVAMSTILDEKV